MFSTDLVDIGITFAAADGTGHCAGGGDDGGKPVVGVEIYHPPT